jgi:transcriptional regulator with XRE-family HTH domain
MSKPTDKMLGVVLRAWREGRRMGIREAAKAIGISHSTLSRIENGKPTDGQTLWRVLLWLNGSAVTSHVSNTQGE